MNTFEEQKQRIEKLNVIDDTLFHKIAEDRETCEEILQVLMENKHLRIVESRAQMSLRNAGDLQHIHLQI